MRVAAVAIVIAAVVVSIVFFPRLPARVPTHWNAAGQIDGYSSRVFGAFLMPVVMIGMLALFAALPSLSPKGFEVEGGSRAYAAIVLALLLFLLVVHVQILLAAMNIARSMSSLIPILTGALFVVLGNYLPKMRRNFFIGIRTPWTLADEDVWFRTHRFGGVLFVVSGILLMVVSPFLRANASFGLLLALALLTAFASIIYSFVIYKKEVSS